MIEKMVITKIEKQKKSKNRLNIYINEEYAFSIHEEVFIAKRLYKDMIVDEMRLEELLLEEEKNKVWNKALKYLSYRPRTKFEVRNYLIEQDYNNDLIDSTINRLEINNYINDKIYVNQFIEQRITANPKGKKFIAYELKNKGISSTDIDSALEKIDYKIEYKMAISLAEKKINQLNKQEWFAVKVKLGNYLQRKGFSYDIIYDVFSFYESKFENK